MEEHVQQENADVVLVMVEIVVKIVNITQFKYSPVITQGVSNLKFLQNKICVRYSKLIPHMNMKNDC